MRKAGKNCCEKKERESGNEEDGCRSRTPRQPGERRGVGSTRSGRKRGKKEAWERSNVVTGTAGGASRRNSPGGAGRLVQLSGNG
jgi:hypothetical protein